MEPKRRLPLLQPTSGDESEGDIRSPWQWVGFGVVAIFVVWVPLSWLAVLAARKRAGLDPTPLHLLEQAAPFALGLALAASVGGYLVGRWGTSGVGAREAAFAGLATALLATVLAWGTAGPWVALLGALVMVPVGVVPAAFGGRLGVRQRR